MNNAIRACFMILGILVFNGCVSTMGPPRNQQIDRLSAGADKGYVQIEALQGDTLGTTAMVFERRGEDYWESGILKDSTRIEIACEPGEHTFVIFFGYTSYTRTTGWTPSTTPERKEDMRKHFMFAKVLGNVVEVVAMVKKDMVTPVSLVFSVISKDEASTKYIVTPTIDSPHPKSNVQDGLDTNAKGVATIEDDSAEIATIMSLDGSPDILTSLGELAADCIRHTTRRGDFERRLQVLLKEEGGKFAVVTYTDGTKKTITPTTVAKIKRGDKGASRRLESHEQMNTLGMRFVPVSGLNGVMFSVWETRNKDFRAFNPTHDSGVDYNGDDQPATAVTRDDAVAFCKWLTTKERQAGTITELQEYRLPTDAEWSAAVGLKEDAQGTPKEKEEIHRRHSVDSIYPWGTQWPPPPNAGNYAGGENAKYFINDVNPRGPTWIERYSDQYKNTAPVGLFDQNQFGLYDMSGNAAEWCSDFYDATRNGSVLRGGDASTYYEGSLRSASRWGRPKDITFPTFGFRAVLATTPAKQPTPTSSPKQ